MPFHESEPSCLWLEFAGARGDHDLSKPFAFIRLTDSQIEGGDQHELIGWYDAGRWVLAADESTYFSRISGEGVFSVHLEQLDGSDVSVECSQVHIADMLLLVDGQSIAAFDEQRGAWTRLATAARLHGIRLEPEAAGGKLLFEVIPQQHADAASGSSHSAAGAPRLMPPVYLRG